MKRTMWLIGLFAAAILVCGTAAQAGPKVDFGDGGYLSFGVLGQVQGVWVDKAADKADIFLRRGRLILNGQIADGIKVFMDTDFPNAGRTGVTPAFIVQDIFADVRIAGDHWAQAGLILLPFSFENGSSAASLLGLDYNAECIKLTNTLTWRDMGAALHGNFGSLVSYKVGVFDGYDAAGKNEKAALRFTGHLAVNVVGAAESGWFYNQVRLEKPNYLSLGAGIDNQKNATAIPLNNVTSVKDEKAWVVDLQSGSALGPLYGILNAAYYHWDNATFKGKTAFVEAGLLYDKAMLSLKYTKQDPDKGTKLNDTTVGLHYFIKGNNLRAGVELRTGDSPDSILAGVQFSL